MKTPQRVTALKRPITGISEPVVVDRWPEQADRIDTLITTLSETNTHLATLADTAITLQSFFKKFLPWMIAAASVAWPVIGQIVSKASTVVTGLPHT